MVYYTTYTNQIDPFESMFHKFNRPFQEVRGFTSEMAEDGNSGKVYINALGVAQEDIDITWKSGEKPGSVIFTVKGETVIDTLRPFNLEVSFLSPRPVKSLRKNFVNGLVILELVFDKPVQPDIEILE